MHEHPCISQTDCSAEHAAPSTLGRRVICVNIPAGHFPPWTLTDFLLVFLLHFFFGRIWTLYYGHITTNGQLFVSLTPHIVTSSPKLHTTL